MINQLLIAANESLVKCIRDETLKKDILQSMKENDQINKKAIDNMKELLKLQLELFKVNNLGIFKQLKLIKEWRMKEIEKNNSVLMEHDDYIDYFMGMNKIEFTLLHNKMKEESEKCEESIEGG